MDNITRTIYGAALQTYTLFGRPVRFLDNTRLNERFGVNATRLPNANQLPSLHYFGIGNGGHRSIVGQNNLTINQPVIHMATDAACYSPLPFVLVPPSADIPPGERARYCMRSIVPVGNDSYVAYWLRRIESIPSVVDLEIRTVDGQTETVDPFVPTRDNLFPVPPALSSTGVNVLDGQYATASCKLALTFDRADIDHLRNVAKILYQSEYYAIISEICMVTGVDYDTTIPAPGGGTYTFKEVIGAQVAAFLNVYYQVVYLNENLTIDVDAGAQEPLYKIDAIAGIIPPAPGP